MLIYVAGPYREGYDRTVQQNIESAEQIAQEVWLSGHAAICPHLNTAHFDSKIDGVSDDQYLNGTMEMLRRCDGIVLAPNWEQSEGAKAEYEYAESVGMPAWIYPLLPARYYCLTEGRSPIQCAAFMDTVMQMYRLHLKKNADYSPANILGTGEIGLVTRLWDKIARLMNLYGFDLTVKQASFSGAKTPNHESIDDTMMDAAVYSIIGMLLRDNKWGK